MDAQGAAQTQARAIAQTSLWVPAKPEHAKIGWTYDFEQTERIARAAYDSTGYDAVMEVVEFVMAEADRRHATALAAKDAELAAERAALRLAADRADRAEALLADANKALDQIANGNHGDRTSVAAHYEEIARRAREAQGGENV